MNIAVVGGGDRCRRLIEVIQQHTFQEIHPRIIAVADTDKTAPGVVLARRKDIQVTEDYNDFFNRQDIDLIVDLTNNKDIYNDILAKKNKAVQTISTMTADLFWEIARVSTLQKKTSQELQEARAMYKMVINELLQEDVLVIAYDHRIIDVNDSLLEKLGLSRNEVIGRPCYEITHKQNSPCSGEHHPCPLIQTLESQKPSQMTHIHLDKNNREIYYSISTYPLKENGDIIGAIEISRDITQEINVQRAMMQQEKLASIGRLSAGVAHEINNPLTTILTSAMLLQEDLQEADSTYQELQIIANEALRCRKIVTSLLDFARQSRPLKKAHAINQILMEGVLLTKKQAAFRDVTVTYAFNGELPMLLIDKGQIEQALINLILNAVEVTSAGGEVRVITDVDAQHNEVLIKVIDHGDGIAKENLARVFDPFFTTKESGTGLGLALTHGIIEQHGGRIEVQSDSGEGTCFTIHLPINQEDVNGG